MTVIKNKTGIQLFVSAGIGGCVSWQQAFSCLSLLLQVVVYHGNKRETSVEELKQADVVLTTYSIVENEFRKNCLPDKVPCAHCNKKFFPDRLKVHLRYSSLS